MQVANLNYSRYITLPICPLYQIFWRTCISKSPRIEWWNHEYRSMIQGLHGSRNTFRSWITKNNFLNSCSGRIQSANHALREYPCMSLSSPFMSTPSRQVPCISNFWKKSKFPRVRTNRRMSQGHIYTVSSNILHMRGMQFEMVAITSYRLLAAKFAYC